MKPQNLGQGPSQAEVTNVSRHGLWVLVDDREYFLPYDKFPWFREARLKEILDVRLLHGFHLHWPALDVDLEIASLDDPAKFPLVDTQTGGAP